MRFFKKKLRVLHVIVNEKISTCNDSRLLCFRQTQRINKNLRHPWKTFAHVHNDVYNRATIVPHPQSES